VTRRRRGRLARGLALVFVGGLLTLAGYLWARREIDLTTLERRRDALRARLAKACARDPRLARAPEADLIVGMPLSLTSRILRHITQGFLGQVEIVLRDLEVHKEGVVRAKTMMGTLRPGRFRLDLTLHEARALLEPGPPRAELTGSRLAVSLPVTVARGDGRATVTLDWDSQGLSRVACEDFRIQERVEGQVVRRTSQVKGTFLLSVEDGALVAEPDFPDARLGLSVEPSASTWRSVENAIEKRSWKCEKALEWVNVPKLLRGLLERGFEVKVPRKVFKPLRLPVGLQRSLVFEQKRYDLDLKLLDLRVTPDILWYGAGVQLKAVARPSE
jgi:hypothetical protein